MRTGLSLVLELAGIALVVGALVVSPAWVQLYAVGVGVIYFASRLGRDK